MGSRSSLRPWRLAGRCVATAMRCVPRPWRFDASVRVAPLLVGAMRRAPQFRLLEQARFDTDTEIALHLVLHTLEANGADFDPRLTIDGYEAFGAACRRGGVLLVSPHTALVLLMLRRFHDERLAPFVVAADANLHIAGTAVVADTVQRSAMSLVQARNRLREGRLVCAMLDRAEHEPKARTREFVTVRGRVIFAPALLHLAARSGARVAFCDAHLEGSRVRGGIVLATSSTPSGVEREYIDYIRTVMQQRAGDVAEPLTPALSA